VSKKVAIIGARGISNWGGFETAAREIAPRLAERGYEVYCSCEKNSCDLDAYKGVKMIYFPVRMPKNYELRKIFEVFYDLYFMIVCSTVLNCDIVYSLGYNANILACIPRLFGKKIVFNMAGLEWERSKFGRVQQYIVRTLFLLASVGANHVIIDHEKLKPYVPSRYHDKVVHLTYGANEPIVPPWDVSRVAAGAKSTHVNQIAPNEYWLVVARLEPDQHIATIVNSYARSASTKPLVVAGDFTSEEYERSVKRALNDLSSDKDVIFTGGIYDLDVLSMLRHNCFAYLHGHSKGGTNPSLLEAMIHRNIVIAHDNVFNRGVCGDLALYFKDGDDLQEKMRMIESDPLKYAECKHQAREKVRAEYSWDKVADQYDAFFTQLLGNESTGLSAEIVDALPRT
jgi:rhamnosyltransferase